MFTLKRMIVRSLILLALAGTAMAQESRPTIETPVSPVPASGPLVTVTASAKRVRFVSPGSVVQLRLEVYNESGQKVFDTELRGGNVLDWHLQDGAGQRLAAGSYACVLTAKSLSGRLSQRMGMVTVNEKAVAPARDAQVSMAQQQTIGPVEGNATFTVREENEAITAVTHDGTDGQLTSTAGALTFRTGDVFAGEEKEHMRITPEGRIGIGTDKPESTLDVAGTIRTTTLKTAGGVEFADGSRLNSSDGKLVRTDAAGQPLAPEVSGTGTTGRLTKWSDGPSGTLSDSLLTESGGGVELRSATASAGINPIFINPNNIAGLALLQAYPATGPNSNLSFAVVPRGTGSANNRAQITVFNTDFIADPNNYEFSSLRARGSDFVFGTGKAGTGINRPIMFATGFLGDNLTNNGQLYLATNGNVGVGTTDPQAKLHVNGAVNFLGLRTQQHATSPNVIGGHSNNTVTDTVFGATISGGGEPGIDNNRVTDNHGTVGGGRRNQAGDNAGTVADRRGSTVGGGSGNTASGEGSTVSGGLGNTASNYTATVGGGSGNTASGTGSTVGGGDNNTASGTGSAIPGGYSNIAAGNHSFAAGEFAKAFNRGSFVWADSTGIEFTSTANNQFIVRAGGGVGINTNSTSAATLNVDGSGLFTGNLTVNGTLNATLPAGSSNYIQNNPAAQQSGANFNISGVGTLGGLTVDINTLHVDAANNRVGVGTTMPESPLHVLGTARASTVRASVNAGSGTAVTVGEYYRDNALIAWAKVFSNGTVTSNETFGITVVRDAVGVYTITLLSTPTNQSIPIATAEVDAAPSTAATARLVTIDQIDLTHFKVYITNGSFAAVDNDFLVMVTGR